MSISITKIVQGTEHAIAAGWQDAIKIGHFVETSVVPALKQAQAEAPLIEKVAALGGPKAQALEAVLFGGNGLVTRTLSVVAAADAAATDLTSGETAKVTVDVTDLVATLKALI